MTRTRITFAIFLYSLSYVVLAALASTLGDFLFNILVCSSVIASQPGALKKSIEIKPLLLGLAMLAIFIGIMKAFEQFFTKEILYAFFHSPWVIFCFWAVTVVPLLRKARKIFQSPSEVIGDTRAEH